MIGLVEIERLGWNEALHPRAGGKFAAKGSGTAGKKDSSEGLSFNGRSGAGYGKKGGDGRVHGLQGELNRLGFTDASGKPLKADGKLGPRTTAAIKKAQKALGLKADGIATPGLLAKLKASKGKLDKARDTIKKKLIPAHKPAPVKRTPPPSKKYHATSKAKVMRSFLGYSGEMTDATRHLPGGHNQNAHGNRVGKPHLIPSKTGLGSKVKHVATIDHNTPSAAKVEKEFSTKDLQDILVGKDASHMSSANRKIEDHRAKLMDAGATREQADAILKDLGGKPERDWESFDPAYTLHHRGMREEQDKAEQEMRAKLAALTPGAYARLLGTDGKPAAVKSAPVRKVFEAMQEAGWNITAAGQGTYRFESPDGAKFINVIAINSVTIYDKNHNKISGVKALAYVREKG